MTLTLRLATPEDGPALAAIYGHYVANTTITFETAVPTAEEMAGRVERILPRFPWLIAELDGAPAGFAYAAPLRDRAAYRWSVETALYVDRELRRRGVGRALYAALIALLKAQGFESAYAVIALPHGPSEALHEAMGFRPCGVLPRVGYKRDTWMDVGWWSLALGGAGDPPAEPVSFADLRARPGWDAPLGSAAS